SEAEGMLDFARREGLVEAARGEVLLEPWSRDSGENLIFSLLAYYKTARSWPRTVGVVSWTSKGLRFQLIACGLKLAGHFQFFGVGEYPAVFLARGCAAEAKYAANIVDTSLNPPAFQLRDPLLRDETLFASKRWKRMPDEFPQNQAGNDQFMQRVAEYYDVGDGVAGRVLIDLEKVRPGPEWESVQWPWVSESSSRREEITPA
ncbi:MAG TPA: hypothetical protein VK633_08510, partial [Verrucomicrobiae bacterium]|nr:hypothetical protein [Verrucomicrobiae bacterium]